MTNQEKRCWGCEKEQWGQETGRCWWRRQLVCILMWTREVTRWGRMVLWKLESKIAAWSYRTSVNRLQWRDLAQHPTSFGRFRNRVMLFCIISEVVTLGWQRYIVAMVTVWLTNHKILPFGMVTEKCDDLCLPHVLSAGHLVKAYSHHTG